MMRSKEDAHDYRYFPDPDLLPVKLDEDWIDEIREEMPELPEQRKQRYLSFGLSVYDASVLNSDWAIGDYFEGVSRACLKDGEQESMESAKLCANWTINEVAAKRNQDELPSWKFGVSDDTLGRILLRVREGIINAKTAKDLFAELWDRSKKANFNTQGGHPQEVDELIETRGLRQMSDSGELEKIIDDVIAANAKSVEEFRSGKEKAFNALVGQVMKASKGKANPAQVNDLLKAKLQ
jgi:aspartyl-tRNA(Asn)/glutamyl-tRNA(Gln) amidotransferase subunit B